MFMKDLRKIPLQKDSCKALYRKVQPQRAEKGGGFRLRTGSQSVYHGGKQPGNCREDNAADESQLPALADMLLHGDHNLFGIYRHRRCGLGGQFLTV